MVRHDLATASKKGFTATLIALLDDLLAPAIICSLVTFLLTPAGGDDDETELETRLGAAGVEFGQNLWGGAPGVQPVLDIILSIYTQQGGYNKIAKLPWFEPFDEATRSIGKTGEYTAAGEFEAAGLNLLNAISILGGMPVIKATERGAKHLKAFHITDPDEKAWTLRDYNREIDKEINNND